MARGLIADTSGIIALLDRDDRHHQAAVEAVKNQEIYVPVTVLPEVDYLATKYLGERVARTFLEDIERDNFSLLPFEERRSKKSNSYYGSLSRSTFGLS